MNACRVRFLGRDTELLAFCKARMWLTLTAVSNVLFRAECADSHRGHSGAWQSVASRRLEVLVRTIRNHRKIVVSSCWLRVSVGSALETWRLPWGHACRHHVAIVEGQHDQRGTLRSRRKCIGEKRPLFAS